VVENQAKKNLQDYLKVYDDLKKLIKQANGEELEVYIRLTMEQSKVDSEDTLRKLFYKIREEE
jgi:hypothetical protein